MKLSTWTIGSIGLAASALLASPRPGLAISALCPPGEKSPGEAGQFIELRPGLMAVRVEPEKGVQGRKLSAHSQIKIMRDGLEVEVRDGEVIKAERGGKPVDVRVEKDGENVTRIVDEHGEVILDVNQMRAQREFNLLTTTPRLAFERVKGGKQAMTRVEKVPGDAKWWGLSGEADQAGDPPPVMLGVTLAEPDWGLLKHLGLERGTATLLSSVYPDLPAAKAGLKAYDVIVAVDGKRPADPEAVRRAIRDKKEGDTLELTVLHRGQEKQVRLNLEKYDQEKLAEISARHHQELVESGDLEFEVFTPAVPPEPPHPGMAPLPPGGPDEALIGRIRGRAGTGQGRDHLFRIEGNRALAERDAARALEEVQERLRAQEHLLQRFGQAAPGGPGGDERLGRLEERLERLESMLERLVEQREQRERELREQRENRGEPSVQPGERSSRTRRS
ncbi:MAG TPA: PDZ domain-containing protein [Phycisphaerales bacterium]|nr:PDZ domain-containing protein [Phycisphaerales bacterium]